MGAILMSEFVRGLLYEMYSIPFPHLRLQYLYLPTLSPLHSTLL